MTAKVRRLKGERARGAGQKMWALVRHRRVKEGTKIVGRAPRVEGWIPKLSHMSGRAAAASETGAEQ